MIYAGLLAAGLGARMHRQDLPKPFLTLGQKPIIIHTLEQFLINPGVDRIIIVAPESWTLYAQDMLRAYSLMGKSCDVIPGGKSKTESIYLLTRYIGEQWSVGEGDMLIAHDAVRPFVTQRIIDDNFCAALRFGAANTAMAMNDTPLLSSGGEKLEKVLPHGDIYAQQTPQTYMLPLLLGALERAVADGTDLAQEPELAALYMRMGGSMRLVRGEYFNMKIINPYDLEVAEALLKERSE